ncbi:MAG: 4a-hydroxytetrahydrobiopterin dehydratase [Acidimicrobiales bacterium]
MTDDTDTFPDDLRDLLAPSLVEAALAVGLQGWSVVDGSLARDVVTDGFAAAIALVVRIGFAAEAADHHPDLDVRWRTVRVRLLTHSRGGITGMDVAMARTIQTLVGPPG